MVRVVVAAVFGMAAVDTVSTVIAVIVTSVLIERVVSAHRRSFRS